MADLGALLVRSHVSNCFVLSFDRMFTEVSRIVSVGHSFVVLADAVSPITTDSMFKGCSKVFYLLCSGCIMTCL